jgi:hypothetical protein
MYFDPTLTVAAGGAVDFFVNVVVPGGYPFNQVVAGDAVVIDLVTTDPAVAALTMAQVFVPIGQYQAFAEAVTLAPGTFKIRADAISGGALGASVLSEVITVTP